MSRFTPARRTAIAVWTGASVLWATTLTALTMEPAVDSSPEGDRKSSEMSATSSAAMPNLPGSGLVVVRGPDSASGGETASGSMPVRQMTAPTSAPNSPQPVSAGS